MARTCNPMIRSHILYPIELRRFGETDGASIKRTRTRAGREEASARNVNQPSLFGFNRKNMLDLAGGSRNVLGEDRP